MPVPFPPYRWSEKAGQYVRRNGRFVPRSEVRRAIDTALLAEQKRTRTLARDLRAGRITLGKWRTEMRDVIKTVHVYSAAASKGGWAQLTQADYGRIGQIVRGEYGHLERFARQISRGDPRAKGGRLDARAMQYAEAGRDTYHQTERAVARAVGYRFERNLLHPADHCAGCLGETARGRVRIGELIPIGRRNCLRRCRCSLAFSR